MNAHRRSNGQCGLARNSCVIGKSRVVDGRHGAHVITRRNRNDQSLLRCNGSSLDEMAGGAPTAWDPEGLLGDAVPKGGSIEVHDLCQSLTWIYLIFSHNIFKLQKGILQDESEKRNSVQPQLVRRVTRPDEVQRPNLVKFPRLLTMDLVQR